MSTINCSLDCFYQRDGHCELNSIENISICGTNECLYYQKDKKTQQHADFNKSFH